MPTSERINKSKLEEKTKITAKIRESSLIKNDQVPDSLFGSLRGEISLFKRDRLNEDHEL